MPSDEERREVARRLREDISCNYDMTQCELEEIVMHECGRGFICDSANEMECRRKTYNRLADLIDPQTNSQEISQSSSLEEVTRNCSEPTRKCDREALLNMADIIESAARENYFSYRTLSKEERASLTVYEAVSACINWQMDTAIKIREYCGVSENGSK